MKKFLLLLTISLTAGYLSAQNEFELVESVPVETFMEQSQLSRTGDVWLKMINEAKQTIDIETFYFANEPGGALEEILQALKNAAARNVKIRIIVDSSFYSSNDKSVDLLEGIDNISIKKIPMGKIAGGVMHAKYFLVDNNNLFVGSQNMDWRALIHIHEIGARVKNDELARTFSELFQTDWLLCDNNYYGLQNMAVHAYVNSENPVMMKTDNYGGLKIFPAFSPPVINMPGLSSEEDQLLNIIGNTKSRLLIQMYSYSLKAKEGRFDAIDNALRDAASRGVDIKIILSDWAIRESAIDFIKDLSTVKNIQIKFSTIPQFSGGFIPYSRVEHCKYFTSDEDISWISTSNWESGYFRNSRNATLIVENKKVNEELSKIFYDDWNGPYTIPVDVNKKYEAVKRN